MLTGTDYEVVALLTTLNLTHRRISMHGVREDMLDRQAAAIGLPITKVWVQEGTNAEYERQMEETLLQFKEQGVSHVIFGDIFLEDLRTYRENNLGKVGFVAHFPLWKEDTTALIQEFIAKGFGTVTCCISTQYLAESFVGRQIDAEFIAELPTGVDVCGENGEFHTYCFAGPIYSNPIQYSLGERVFRSIRDFGVDSDNGFWYVDILPAKS